MSLSITRSITLLAAAATVASAAADRSTWQAEANITGVDAECAPYNFPPATAIQATYPSVWSVADLSHKGVLAADRAIFTAMNSSIPKIAPKGTPTGDFSKVKYNGATDPDCWWSYTNCVTPKLAGLEPDISSCPEPQTWGFTLDDGPNCSHNAYYDYLQSIEQKATLFYIGSNVLDLPLEAQRGLADGHEICAHTWSHQYMTSMTNEQAFAEIFYSKKIIKEIMGITVTCWRPPYGDVDDRIRYIAAQLGLKTILWKHDTFDGSYPDVTQAQIYKNYQEIINQGLNGTYDTSGIIVLTHEIQLETMQFSQHFLPSIAKAFPGGVMPVGTCSNITQPYAEGDAYVYPNYAQYAAGTRSITLASPTAAGAAATFGTSLAVTSSGLPAGAASSPTSSASVANGTKAAAAKTTATGGGGGATKAAASTAPAATTSAVKPSSAAGANYNLAGSLLAGLLGVAGFAVALA